MALSVEQRVLLRLRPQLIHHLHPFTDIIANRLRTLGLFTESTKQQILMSNCTSMQQCRNLLDVMVRCGPQFFVTFLQCLNDVGHGYMAQHLRNTSVAIKQGSEKLPVLQMNVSLSTKNHTKNDEDTAMNEMPSEQNQKHKPREGHEDTEMSQATITSHHQRNCSDCVLHLNQMFQHMQDVLRNYNDHLREIERSISIMTTRNKCFSCTHCKN